MSSPTGPLRRARSAGATSSNVETIIRRLDRMGYRFWNGRQGRTGPQPLQMMMGGKVTAYASPEAMLGQAMRTDLSRIPADMRRHAERARDRVSVLSGLVQGLQKQQAAQAQRKAAITDHLKDEVVFSAPMKEEIAAVRRLEKERLILPLSLRAWVEEVGHVNLSGEHPALCFWASEGFPGVYADPLMIFLDHFILESEAGRRTRPHRCGAWLGCPGQGAPGRGGRTARLRVQHRASQCRRRCQLPRRKAQHDLRQLSSFGLPLGWVSRLGTRGQTPGARAEIPDRRSAADLTSCGSLRPQKPSGPVGQGLVNACEIATVATPPAPGLHPRRGDFLTTLYIFVAKRGPSVSWETNGD